MGGNEIGDAGLQALRQMPGADVPGSERQAGHGFERVGHQHVGRRAWTRC